MGSLRTLACRLCCYYRASALRASCTGRLTTSSSLLPSLTSPALALSSSDRAPNISFRSFPTTKDPSRSLSQLSLPSDGADKLLLVDTLALVRKLEAQGFDAKQAKAITAAMTDILNDCLQNASDSFVSKSELEQYNMMLGSACTKLETDLQSEQEKRLSAIHRETEKLRVDIEKLHGEIRFEMDKVAAGQRLDLNLERGRIKEELASRNAETSNLTNKLDKEINALKMQLEGSKYDVIKYCIGTIVSVYALGLGLLQVFK